MTDSSADLYARAVALQRERRLLEAEEILRELARTDLRVKVAYSLGFNLELRGELAEAEHWMMLAARNRPLDVEIRLGLGRIYSAQGRIAAAELELRTALALNPQHHGASMALGALLLSVGDYAEGWKRIEARVQMDPNLIPPVNVAFPEWQGEPLSGKSILIWYEQGYGDQIQFARFVRTLKERGAARVAIGCRPPLFHLFSTLAGADEVIEVPRNAMVAVPRYDYWTRYFSAPRHLGITLQNLPNRPYLSAPADRRERWAGYSGVGLAWRASVTGFNGANKSLSRQDAARLLDLGAVSLDPEDTGVSDFADTAAIIEQLDLVISIDTSVAHLAGAMGKPVWTLLPAVLTDWRWLRERSDSPWYPTMRLYRQARAGDWTPLLDQVLRDLGPRLSGPLGRKPQPAPEG